MINRFKLRNFDNHHDNFNLDLKPQDDLAFSNYQYDSCKGITHILHHYSQDNPKLTRFVGDVELCMSSDLDISSLTSAEHKNIIRNNITSQLRGPVGKQPTDEQLLRNGAIKSLERDELVIEAKRNLSSLNRDIDMASLKYSHKLENIDNNPQVDNPTPNT